MQTAHRTRQRLVVRKARKMVKWAYDEDGSNGSRKYTFRFCLFWLRMARRRSGCMSGDNCCWPRPLGNLDFHLPLGKHITRESMVDKNYRKGDIQQWLSMRKGDGSSSSNSNKDSKKDKNVETIWRETRSRLTKSAKKLGLIYSWHFHALYYAHVTHSSRFHLAFILGSLYIWDCLSGNEVGSAMFGIVCSTFGIIHQYSAWF